MSRFGDSDADREADGDELLTGICSDCGADIVMRANDLTEWCEPCAAKRERWAAALAARLQAKAALTMTQRKERA